MLVGRDMQALPPALGGGGRAKAENWFEMFTVLKVIWPSSVCALHSSY